MDLQLWLRDDYNKAFDPPITQWGIFKYPTTRGKLGKSVVFYYGVSSGTLIYDNNNTLLKEGRIRILIYSIEGSITSLQPLVTMEKELDRLEVLLGFSLRTKKDEPKRPRFFC